MRLFIAVEVSEKVRDAVARILRDLKETARHSRFVKPEKLHLTLQFLGLVEADKLEPIKRSIDEATTNETKLTLAYRRGGAFGRPSAPKVLWIGVEGEVPKLAAIQKKIEQALKPQGFEPEHRDYSPHLTLARAKSFKGDRELAACIPKLETFEVQNDEVKRVVLMESIKGEYRVIHAADLA